MQLEAILTQGGRGAIVDEETACGLPIYLPFVFNSHDLAQNFLSACERAGINLYPGMSHSDMCQLYRLWKDGTR